MDTPLHYYTPETKIQSKQWVEAGCSAPKKAKVVPGANKIMATVFWDARGVIFIDYLRKGKTITGEYYASLLNQLNEKLKENRPHTTRKKVLFQQDNAPAPKSAIAIANLVELRFDILSHAPYSPDLAPSDFFLFPNLKNWLGGKRFSSHEEVIAETKDLGLFAVAVSPSPIRRSRFAVRPVRRRPIRRQPFRRR